MNLESSSPDSRLWGMILHLSVFAAYVVPIAGVIAPIVIWQVKKDQMPEIDAHGKIVANFIISYIIYFVVAFILTLFIIGIPLMIALTVIGILFPIIGAIKANNGEVWPYPLTIRFFN